jgi:hypothetical protein
MLHSLLTRGPKAKGMALIGGSGESKDKWMVVALVVIIVLAGFALAMSIFSKGGRPKGPSEYTIKCVNPQCNNEWVLTKEQFNNTDSTVQGPMAMESVRTFVCPKCNQKTGFREAQCPACGKYYLPNQAKTMARMKTEEPEKCPNCGVVFAEWWAKHPKGK